MKKKTTKQQVLDVPERPRPTIYLSEKEVPAIKGWKIGEKYEFKIKAEMTSISNDMSSGQEKVIEARFVVLKVTEAEKQSNSEDKADSAYKANAEKDKQ
jgi:hypothetical protein